MSANEITIPLADARLGAEIDLVPNAIGLVLFAHGSGSSRHSPRNKFVAKVLQDAGIGTLLLDLLTVEEEQAETFTRHLRFNIPILARRLMGATQWAWGELMAPDLSIGYFGSSTGAAAAK